MTEQKFKIDIIGSGIGGMATAYYLSRGRDDVHIRLWERAPTAGGLAGCFEHEGMVLEKFYHHIFKGDTGLLRLISELGLNGQMLWKPAQTASYYQDRAYRLSSPADLLRFKPLGLTARLRMGLMVLRARMIKDWEKLDDMTAGEYIIKTGGREVYEKVWAPLLRGKFGTYADQVSAAWLWSKFVDRGSSRSSGGQEVLGYLQGGLGLLFGQIEKELRDKGHEVYYNCGVKKLTAGPDGKIRQIVTAKGPYETDLVVSTAQTADLGPLVADLDKNYAEQLGRIQYLANTCLVLFNKQSLSVYYWNNIADADAPFVGLVEQTNWIGPEHYKGHHLVYLSSYLPRGDQRWGMDAGALFDYYLPYIRKMFPGFDAGTVRSKALWKAAYAQPLVHTGYRHDVPAIQSPVENLLVCAMAQIYPNDRQLSNGVDKARQTVELIGQKIEERP